MAKKEIANNKPRFSSKILVAGVLLMIIGGLMFIDRYRKTNSTPDLPMPALTITTDTDEPEESKPAATAIAEYSVPANQPRSIRIGSVSVNGLIQKIGITDADAMAVPTNIHFAGWFVDSVKPGEPGLSIINGHVLGRYADAVFKNLKKIKTGDEIEVEFGDRSIKKFEVIETVTLPADASAARLFTQNTDIPAQLNLITCTGKFDIANQTYSDRVIVISKLKE